MHENSKRLGRMKYLLHSQPAKQSPLASARWPQLYTASRIQTRPRGPSGLCSSHSRPQGGGGPAVCDNSMLQQGRAEGSAPTPHISLVSRAVALLPLSSQLLSVSLSSPLLQQAICNARTVRGLSLSLSPCPCLVPRQKKLKSIAFTCNLQTSFCNACMKTMTKEMCMHQHHAWMDHGWSRGGRKDEWPRRSKYTGQAACPPHKIQGRCDDAC